MNAVNDKLELSIRHIGERLSVLMQQEQPGVFNKDYWSGRMLDFAMRDHRFKIEMFRFVDVFAALKSSDQVSKHLKEYFLRPELEFPSAIQWLVRGAASGIGQWLGGSNTIASQIKEMAKRFIVGESEEEAIKACAQLRQERVGFTLDLLGEAALSEEEAAVYLARYQQAMVQLAQAATTWRDEPLLDADSLGAIPKINVSIKISSLYPALDPLAFEHSVTTLYQRLLPLLIQARALNVFVNLDLEQHSLKALTFELFRRLRVAPELKGYPHLGLVIQAYLKDSLQDAEQLIAFAKQSQSSFTVRLVKGAYWDYETIMAQQKGWPCPVFAHKHETDANYEAICERFLAAFPHIRLAVASHNLRTISHALAFAEQRKLSKTAFEIQMLYGMAEPIRKALVSEGHRVRVYAPVGALLPGMAYLVRRLLENTSNESFLRQRFVENQSLQTLLQRPQPAMPETSMPQSISTLNTPFQNEPLRDFSDEALRTAFLRTFTASLRTLPLKVTPFIAGRAIKSGAAPLAVRENPADRTVIVSETVSATRAQAEQALASALAHTAWSDTAVTVRAQVLLKAAALVRQQRDALSALLMHEVGKNAREADADVCEAIDFCEYYAREAVRLMDKPQPLLSMPGESNTLRYDPRGVATVIAPWNFPFAILMGMVSAALVTGNRVLMKPAEQSAAVGLKVYQVLIQAGVPEEALHFVPGLGEEVGAYLAAAPAVSLVAFTGSREVGLSILRASHDVSGGHLKKLILELGGKNAAIVDSDADLDEAVLGILTSAFGFAGQKCSACSRAIVVEARYDEFRARLLGALRSLNIGAPSDLHAQVGPVIDQAAHTRLLQAIAQAQSRYETISLPLPEALQSRGYYVPPTVVFDVNPQDPLAQEELFGPLLSVIRAQDFEQALTIAGQSAYALTGGLYSRSPVNIEAAKARFRVGNLYINRGITGAAVARQPFGGAKMSGIGSKAGGPDYLLQFIEPRVITENTMRRGFAPEL